MNAIQEFNKRRSIYHVVHSFITKNFKVFKGQDSTTLSKHYCRLLAESGDVLLNGKPVFVATLKVKNNDLIEVPSENIKFNCIENPSFQDHVPSVQQHDVPQKNDEPDESPSVDDFVYQFLAHELQINDITKSELDKTDPKKAFAFLTLLFQTKDFLEIKTSKYSYELTSYLLSKIRDLDLYNEFGIPKKQLSFSGKVIEILLLRKREQEQKLEQLVSELTDGIYDSNLFKFLQELSRIHSYPLFQFLVSPLLNPTVSSRAAVENLIKLVNEAARKGDPISKFSHFDQNKKSFVNYKQNAEGDKNPYSAKFFTPIATYLFDLFREICQTKEERPAAIDVAPTKRRYNFGNKERVTHELYIFLSNKGEGLAKNIRLYSESPAFDFQSSDDTPLLYPGEQREVSITTKVFSGEPFNPLLKVKVQYEEIAGNLITKHFSFNLPQQEKSIPWDELIKLNPYSIRVIDEKEKLFGREEILRELKTNILSNNIESYKIWGQKRVGKSSIVKTLKSMLSEEPNVLVVYRSLGGLRNSNPERTLNDLGESLCSELLDEIDAKNLNPLFKEKAKSLEIPIFTGSLNPLENFIKKIHRLDNNLKMVFILDEFDRINDEFFMPGNLGETLSLSIGKGLNEYSYIGFILVGSENMHLLDRQGINYNSYREKEVDTFNKQTEFNSYQHVVIGPVSKYISYSGDAVHRIFDATNGNPYFTNLVCYNAFKRASTDQDSEVDIHSIDQAIDEIVNSSQKSHFEHFWGDGLVEETSSRKEKKVDTRRRLLVSFSNSFSKSHGQFPARSELIKNFKFPVEYKSETFEVENTITEFFNRKIFFEEQNNLIRIKPWLFEKWLCGPGKTLMIEGVTDLEAMERENQLELELALKPVEIRSLAERIKYKGKKIPPEAIRSFLSQFGGHSEQRTIFKLLDQILFISQNEVNEFYRKNQRNIFSRKDITLGPNVHTYRRDGVEVYCFSKRFEESKLLSQAFKLASSIRTNKVTRNLKDESDLWKKNNAEEVIIFQPIVDDITEFDLELINFLNSDIKATKIVVKLVVLLSTSRGRVALRKLISSQNNIKLLVYKDVEETAIKPFIESSELFENLDESNQCFALMRRFFPHVPKDGLLVLFETICPSNSIPILWSHVGQYNPLFLNHFVKVEPAILVDENERLRTRVYHANTELSQKLNSFIVAFLKAKATKEGRDDWFRVEYIPKKILNEIHARWVDEGQKHPRESYFDFINYKEIIKANKEITSLFQIGSDGFGWCERLNVLRRDPAHPEKPAPSLNDVEEFEAIKKEILSRIDSYKPAA